MVSQTCHWGPPCFHLWNHARCILVWLAKWGATVCCSSVSFIMVAHHFDVVTHPVHSQIWELELWAWPLEQKKKRMGGHNECSISCHLSIACVGAQQLSKNPLLHFVLLATNDLLLKTNYMTLAAASYLLPLTVPVKTHLKFYLTNHKGWNMSVCLTEAKQANMTVKSCWPLEIHDKDW